MQNQHDKIDIMSEVEFRETPQLKWDFFDETKFSRIYVGTVHMMYVLPNRGYSEEISKLMVKKEKLRGVINNDSRNRIQQEHIILKRIANLQCINISRYYFL